MKLCMGGLGRCDGPPMPVVPPAGFAAAACGGTGGGLLPLSLLGGQPFCKSPVGRLLVNLCIAGSGRTGGEGGDAGATDGCAVLPGGTAVGLSVLFMVRSFQVLDARLLLAHRPPPLGDDPHRRR